MATQGEAIVDFPGAKAKSPTLPGQPPPTGAKTRTGEQAGAGAGAGATSPEQVSISRKVADRIDLEARASDFLSTPIDKDISIDYQTQKDLYFALSGISEQFAKLAYTGDSQRALFEQVKHLTEICGGRLDGTKTIFENGQQVNLALRAIEVYQGLLLRGLGYRVTSGGTKNGQIDLSEIIIKEPGEGFGLIWPKVFGFEPFANFLADKAGPGIGRFLIKEGDKTIGSFSVSRTETAVVTNLLKIAGAEGWSNTRLAEEIKALERSKILVTKAIGLEPYEDLADCNLAAIPHPEAGPASEAGGVDAFENHRRIKFEELIGQTSSDTAKSLQEKWEALNPEQQLELWLRSYDLAAEDVFEDFAKKMAEEKDREEAEKGTHVSRGARLKEKGARLRTGGGVVTQDMIDKAALSQKQAQETFDSLKKVQEDLVRINNELAEANEVVIKNDKYLKLLKEQRDEWIKTHTTTGGLFKGTQVPSAPPVMLEKIDTITLDLANAQAKSDRLESHKTQLIRGFFKGETDPLGRQAVIHATEVELEKLRAEVQRLSEAKTAGHLEASQADKDQGDRLDRLGQIVGERNAIIGKVDQQWLKELDTLIKQGKLDKAHGLILELIFESTDTAAEQLTIDAATQAEFLSQAKIVKVAMETLGLDTRQLTGDEKTDLAKAFVKIAPFLSRNTVQSQRVIGALIDQLYDDAYHDRLGGLVKGDEIAPSPTEQPRMKMEVKKVQPSSALPAAVSSPPSPVAPSPTPAPERPEWVLKRSVRQAAAAINGAVTGAKETLASAMKRPETAVVPPLAPAEAVTPPAETINWGDEAINIELPGKDKEKYVFNFYKTDEGISFIYKEPDHDIEKIKIEDIYDLRSEPVFTGASQEIFPLAGRHFMEDFRTHRDFLTTAFMEDIKLETAAGKKYKFDPRRGLEDFYDMPVDFKTLKPEEQEELCALLGEKLFEAWFKKTSAT